MITDEIFRAIGYLFISGIVITVFNLAKKDTNNSINSTLFKGLLICGGIALFASLSLGSPSCESGSDPVYGGCEYYADDGFEPSAVERIANFMYYMTLLYVPVVIGALNKKTTR